MARLNENFDSDESHVGPLATPHAMSRSHSKYIRGTLAGNQQSQATTKGQKSHKASTEEELRMPPLESTDSITRGRSGKNSLRRQRLLTPLYVNLLALPTQTDAAQSEHGLGYLSELRNVKQRSLTPRMNVKTPAHPVSSASELLRNGSTILEVRQVPKDLLEYVLIDSTSGTDDDAQGDSFQRKHREAFKPRVQTLPKLQLHGIDSNVSGKSARNFPSTTAKTTPSSKPILEILVADYSSSKANISPESRLPEDVVCFR